MTRFIVKIVTEICPNKGQILHVLHLSKYCQTLWTYQKVTEILKIPRYKLQPIILYQWAISKS